MAKFVDVYLLPIKEENVPAYKKLASAAGKIFRKHGAVTYREYVAADLKVEGGPKAFPQIVKLKPGETIVYAAVEFKSEAQRNKALQKIFNDPEMNALMPKDPPFDFKRMVYGGFSILVDA